MEPGRRNSAFLLLEEEDAPLRSDQIETRPSHLRHEERGVAGDSKAMVLMWGYTPCRGGRGVEGCLAYGREPPRRLAAGEQGDTTRTQFSLHVREGSRVGLEMQWGGQPEYAPMPGSPLITAPSHLHPTLRMRS